MQKPKYESLKDLNLDSGMNDFDNNQHITVKGKVPKNSEYFWRSDSVDIQINFAKLKGKYGFNYFLSNDFMVFSLKNEKKFIYNSIQELYSGIIKELTTFAKKNFKHPKTTIYELNNALNFEYQGFLKLY
jgi:RecG-like helicase